MSNKIIVTRGLPGSGKSTWAREMCALFNGTIMVERDELRQALTGAFWTGDQEVEEQVTRMQEALVRGYLAGGMTVIVSDTHLPDRSVKKWAKLGHELGVPVQVQDFRHVPLEQCLINNAERGKWSAKVVPEEVIIDKHQRFIKGRDLSKEVTYTPSTKRVIEPYVQPDGTKHFQRAVIFDIDGTLAIMGDRSPYDGAKVYLDSLNRDVHHALTAMWDLGAQIIIVSGRDEEYREVTEKWLADNGVEYDALYMRPTEPGPKREDSIIKYELFNQHIRPEKYRILGVYDDRHRVLRMWRELGLTTFHVNGPDAGDF